MNIARQIKNWDIALAGSALVILALGLTTIFSSTLDPGQGFSYYAKNQMIFAAMGLAVLFGISFLDYRVYRYFVFGLYALSLILLVTVLFIGSTAFGSTSWIDIGPFQFQPSELAKVSVILILAHYFARKSKHLLFRHIIISGLFVLPFLLLVYLQPDLGTAIVFVVIWFSLFFAAKPNWKHVAVMVLAALIILPLGWNSLKGYQKSRFTVFVNNLTGRPIADDESLGAGYNVIQSQIAVGSGRLAGRGLGKGTQSTLDFLPEQSQQTDFIFAVYAEQLGFVGSLVLLGLFGLLIFRLFKIAEVSRDAFGSLIAIGAGSFFLFHVLVNIGFNIGVMPVTGIPLPFMSYGGSALLASFIMVGMAQNIYAKRKDLEFAK